MSSRFFWYLVLTCFALPSFVFAQTVVNNTAYVIYFGTNSTQYSSQSNIVSISKTGGTVPTPSPTASPTATRTSLPSNTPTHTATATITLTPQPSITPTIAPTNTPEITPTASPTSTPTPTKQKQRRRFTVRHSDDKIRVLEFSMNDPSTLTTVWEGERNEVLLVNASEDDQNPILLTREDSSVRITHVEGDSVLPNIPAATRFTLCENNLFMTTVNQVMVYSVDSERPQLKVVRSSRSTRYMPDLVSCINGDNLVIGYQQIANRRNDRQQSRQLGVIKGAAHKPSLRRLAMNNISLRGARSIAFSENSRSLAILYPTTISIFNVRTSERTENRPAGLFNNILTMSSEGCLALQGASDTAVSLSCQGGTSTIALGSITISELFPSNGPISLRQNNEGNGSES